MSAFRLKTILPPVLDTADLSAVLCRYAAGLVLMYGNIEPEYYDDPYLHDKALLELVSRIKCLPSDEAETPELSNLCELEIVLKSGSITSSASVSNDDGTERFNNFAVRTLTTNSNFVGNSIGRSPGSARRNVR